MNVPAVFGETRDKQRERGFQSSVLEDHRFMVK